MICRTARFNAWSHYHLTQNWKVLWYNGQKPKMIFVNNAGKPEAIGFWVYDIMQPGNIVLKVIIEIRILSRINLVNLWARFHKSCVIHFVFILSMFVRRMVCRQRATRIFTRNGKMWLNIKGYLHNRPIGTSYKINLLLFLLWWKSEIGVFVIINFQLQNIEFLMYLQWTGNSSWINSLFLINYKFRWNL